MGQTDTALPAAGSGCRGTRVPRRSALKGLLACALALPWVRSADAGPGPGTGPRRHEPAPLRIVYPVPDNPLDVRNGYPLAVLRLALQGCGRPVELVPASVSLPPARAVEELAGNSGLITILWTMTTADLERRLLPVRIPIEKGLLGWRLALVRSERREQFAGVRGLAQLRQFSAGQEQEWPDVKVLRAAGLPVVTADRYLSLFAMLKAGRFDYFPRSLDEIGGELDRHRSEGLEVDPYLILHYPAAAYFFLNRGDTALAELLRAGLERAVADGSLDRLFTATFDGDLRRFRPAQRLLIELANPEAPGTLPLERPALWFQLRPALPP